MNYDYFHLHVDLFKIISKLYNIENVIEFGAGEISTKNLLNKNIFPNIKKLFSIEDSKQWIDSLNIKDERWFPVVISNSFSFETPTENILNNNKIDVVLVDSITIESRIKNLEFLLKHNINFIILHDSQHSQYDNIISKYKYAYKLDFIPANATIVSNLINIKESLKEELNEYLINKTTSRIG